MFISLCNNKLEWRIIEIYGLQTLKENVSFVMITQQQASRLTDYIAEYEKKAVVV